MPIYEYLCTACQHRADILLGINDPGPQFCPSCGREGTMRKQFAPPTIHFKGSGWAKKDRGAASSTRAAAAAGSKAGDGGDGSGSSASSDAGSSGDAAKPSTDSNSSGGSKAAEGSKSGGSKSGGSSDKDRG
ncbi:MAG TPA: zinc ribbon domain-containing protein [Candidatus Limnocylindrales bacterium]|jgi:putative FmdB family regulatory protein